MRRWLQSRRDATAERDARTNEKDEGTETPDRGGGQGWRGRDVARRAGRIVLWVAVGLIFFRGLGAVASGPQKRVATPAAHARAAAITDQDAQAFAVRFTRVYLSWRAGDQARHASTVGGFFSSDVRDRAAAELPRRGPGQVVAQATVARSMDLGSGRALITVASQLAHGRTIYLTVPVARDSHGGLNVFALPALTAPPPGGSASVSERGPLTGRDAGEIQTLVKQFLTAYVSGQDPSGLAYLVAPGTAIAGMPAGLALGSVDQVGQLNTSGRRMTVQADVHVRDQATRASYPLAYRLELVRADRWYVTGVQGGPRA